MVGTKTCFKPRILLKNKILEYQVTLKGEFKKSTDLNLRQNWNQFYAGAVNNRKRELLELIAFD